MLVIIQLAYRKHHLMDDRIGWDELSRGLLNVLTEVMGDEEFIKWKEELK